MFKDIAKTIAICAFGMAMAARGGQANAQQSPASNQIQVTATKTMDLLNARFVSIAAGNQYIIDANGTQVAASFPHIEAITYAPAFANYIIYSPGLYLNLTKTTSVDCISSASVITWASGGQTSLTDGCAFNDNTKAYSRRW